MESKGKWLMNLSVIGGIVLLALALLVVTKLTPRTITPNAGVLEGFEPAVTTQQPEGEPSSGIPGIELVDGEEVIWL